MTRLRISRPTLSIEAIAALASVYFAAVSSRLFWNVAMPAASPTGAGWWKFGLVLLVTLVSLHLFLLCIVLSRRTAKVLLTVLLVASAFATYYMQEFGVYLTPNMMRNLLHTQSTEAADLVGMRLLRHILVEGVAPATLLWWVRIRRFRLRVAGYRRIGTMVVSLCLLLLAVVLGYQDIADLFRNHKEARYLITPANYLYSLPRSLVSDVGHVPAPLAAVGRDARLETASGPRKPVLFVIVVGETARSANWGLNGYDRPTTPELANLDVINFSNVHSCGSDTETSLPCMFSATGRRNYDERRIRGSESLLHVVKRAGFQVLWRDNQTGCKGVCAGLDYEQVDQLHPGACNPGDCFDEVLLDGLDAFAAARPGNKLVVLHQMGNHGPSSHHRYPDSFRRFTPTCDTSEIRRCSIEEIVNSYDNALRYTDHFLAETIGFLKSQQSYDTALLYVSDHGESLGEGGLFLHGVPYAIAPAVQTSVPMVLWTSEEFRSASALDESCVRARENTRLSHDHLFHTILGLLQIQTAVLEPRYDFSDGCRGLLSPQVVAGGGTGGGH